jgi:hypothetical protein
MEGWKEVEGRDAAIEVYIHTPYGAKGGGGLLGMHIRWSCGRNVFLSNGRWSRRCLYIGEVHSTCR